MKDSGASHSLKILITLEALLNDGSALVLFNLFFNALKQHPDTVTFSSAGSIAVYFVRILLLSPLVGVSLGLASCYLISFASRRLNSEDVLVQVVLTISCAYLSFFIGEHFLHVSGVLTCIFSGKYANIYA